jgi:hypothetical protein
MKLFTMIALLSISSMVFAGYDYIITEGDFVGLSLDDHQALLMTGGGGDSLSLSDWSYGKIQNTSPYSVYPRGGIREILLMGYSHLDFYNGDVFTLSLSAYSTAAIYGGQFSEIMSGQSAWKHAGDPPVQVPNPHIEIVCRDWLYNAANKRLTGTWGDFSAFNIKLLDVQGYSPTIDNIQFTIIPEPMSLMLLALGGLLLRRNQR